MNNDRLEQIAKRHGRVQVDLGLLQTDGDGLISGRRQDSSCSIRLSMFELEFIQHSHDDIAWLMERAAKADALERLTQEVGQRLLWASE